MKPMRVAGFGFWAPGLADAGALVDAALDPALSTPPVGILGKRGHARASLLTRMLCHVAARACQAAAAEPSSLPVVFGSAHGEVGRLEELITRPAGTPVSPLRFQNSVHNTAGGQFSIATRNRNACTAISAGDQTVSSVLLEAYGVLHEGAERVLVGVGEEPAPPLLGGPLATPLALAMVLTNVDSPGSDRDTRGAAMLTLQRPEAGDAPGPPPKRSWASHGPLAAFADSPCRGAAALALALQRPSPGRVPIEGPRGHGTGHGAGLSLQLEISP